MLLIQVSHGLINMCLSFPTPTIGTGDMCDRDSIGGTYVFVITFNTLGINCQSCSWSAEQEFYIFPPVAVLAR